MRSQPVVSGLKGLRGTGESQKEALSRSFRVPLLTFGDISVHASVCLSVGLARPSQQLAEPPSGATNESKLRELRLHNHNDLVLVLDVLLRGRLVAVLTLRARL